MSIFIGERIRKIICINPIITIVVILFIHLFVDSAENNEVCHHFFIFENLSANILKIGFTGFELTFFNFFFDKNSEFGFLSAFVWIN